MRKLFILLALGFTAHASASSAVGTLYSVHFMDNGVVIAYTTGSRSGTVPSCALQQLTRFALDGTTPGGKVQLAGLLTAYSAGKPVAIVGTGGCGPYSDTETISYFHTID